MTNDQGANIKKVSKNASRILGRIGSLTPLTRMLLCINKAESETKPLWTSPTKCVAIVSFSDNNSVAKKVLDGKWETYFIAVSRADGVPALTRLPLANVGPCANLPKVPSNYKRRL
jgi:hypothetical protein